MEKSDDLRNYFCFDDKAREVLFRRYDPPMPWMNYLSNGTFHTMISQAGGAVAFYKSPQIWRISRYRFFHLPMDRSGHYIYLRDADTGEYWSPTCEPARLKPETWQSAHGMGYTRFEALHDGLAAKLTYFVGPFANALIWRLHLQNRADTVKDLDVFAYVEFGMMEFMRELQWQCYNKHQVSVRYRAQDGALVYRYGVENQPRPDETPLVYLTADRQPVSYDGDRDAFVGSYRSETDPVAVETGGCTGSELMGGDPCGALQFKIRLEPGQETELHIFLGTAMTEEEIADAAAAERQPDFVPRSFAALQENWRTYLEKFQCELPDEDAQRMINTWNPYQAQRNFLFSRNISFYATGTFRGVGFRDTSQDVLAQIPFDAEAAKEKTRMLLGQQYADGHVNHYFFPIEGWEPVTSIHSDDHLWPILTVWNLVMETGNLAFLDETVPFYDGGVETVYTHLCRSVAFSQAHMGADGFPLMLRSDWNDALFRVAREGRGESIWTAMQLGVMLPRLAQLARLKGADDDAAAFMAFYDRLRDAVNQNGWDGQWYRRAVMDDGAYLGTKEQTEAKIWLNTQTWSVLSDMAADGRGKTAMDSVARILNTELGIKAIDPPIVQFPSPADPLTNYNPGTGENGSVFCHANTWAVIAECLLRRGDRAYRYYRQLIPAVAMEKAGIRRYRAEPYVYSSNLFGPDSDKFGLANVSWLTGTAAWMYIAASQYILGVRPCWEGLTVDPCLPPEWKHARVTRLFRGCRYDIAIENETGEGTRVKALEVDGHRIDGCTVPHEKDRGQASVRVIL